MNQMNSKQYNLFRTRQVLKLLIFINYYDLYLQKDRSSFTIMIHFVQTDTSKQNAKKNVQLL